MEDLRFPKDTKFVDMMLGRKKPINMFPFFFLIFYFISFHSQLSSNELGVALSAETLRAFNRGTNTTVDDQLGKNTNSTSNTEQNSVVAGFGQTVVLKEDTRVL